MLKRQEQTRREDNGAGTAVEEKINVGGKETREFAIGGSCSAQPIIESSMWEQGVGADAAKSLMAEAAR
ncbi:hypothetical protein Baya_8398 [Bagarius yarrelli]|uniref:Uncharacterized protein n=1 Tax=Bagarius yarrelli TaxID=175774 RepID=A0A556U5K4_BAGYA|nr:hypothetical protein Baya_8398 [Bagarius yarrelli]